MLTRFVGFCILVSLSWIAQPALAQGVSGKTLRIVVPYAAGGTGDVVTRVLSLGYHAEDRPIDRRRRPPRCKLYRGKRFRRACDARRHDNSAG